MTTSSTALWEPLEPRFDSLWREEVLVQAWKKASGYIRYHNWFSDTLELDWTTVNLPDFLGDVASALKSPNPWETDTIRIVPAPKSQPGWKTEASEWKHPKEVPLRPLAHVTLRDQVVATAIMLCLADRVETRQGHPLGDVQSKQHRKTVVSYGNRLFCDRVCDDEKTLRHRWGSSKLYRKYFQDYRNFLRRPEAVVRGLVKESAQNPASPHERPYIVSTDLSRFYDRVRSDMLSRALEGLSEGPEEQSFFAFADSMLKWQWDSADRPKVEEYEHDGDELAGFENEVALPQGLVAAGFFANVVLLDFDELVVGHFGQEIVPGVRLHDFCRYVDDMRLVVSTTNNIDADAVGNQVQKWLQEVVDETADGLKFGEKKTKTISFAESVPQLIRLGATMDRIQTAVSGGFDAIEGERILDTVQSLIRSQPAAFADDDDEKWYLSPVPDVRDDTLARFCARRFRTTYRSLRPLLEAADAGTGLEGARLRSQSQLDNEAKSFSLTLIDRWVKDPSNIGVLRIALDLWPHPKALEAILELLGQFVWNEEPTSGVRVAWYCLSEIFRAGATETGMVGAEESLHGGIDIADYRDVLRAEALKVMSAGSSMPWYLRQQAFLFLAATGHVGSTEAAADDLPVQYGHLTACLSSASAVGDYVSFATAAVLVRRAFQSRDESVGLVLGRLYGRPPGEIGQVVSAIGTRDLSFLEEILESRPHLEQHVDDRLRLDLGRLPGGMWSGSEARPSGRSLTEWIQDDALVGPLRNELTLLRFAERFLQQWRSAGRDMGAITPSQVYVDLADVADEGARQVDQVAIAESTVATDGSIYQTPAWCPEAERWRLQLGYLLRFVLAGRPDYTRPIRAPGSRERSATYRPPENHWYLRRYGFYNAQQAFGDDWLPISDWLEHLLMALLRWPGCRPGPLAGPIQAGIEETVEAIQERVSFLETLQGRRTGLLILPVAHKHHEGRSPIHACVAQTVIPGEEDFTKHQCDPTLSDSTIRGDHRRHLAATLMAVRRMVEARASHFRQRPRLDWLILPELAVHPDDVQTHLVPFARAHKCLILTGVTYQELRPGDVPVNSALWLMPEYSPEYGSQMRIRRQGKGHLAPEEEKLNVKGFRPCQWLIDFPCEDADRGVRLTASLCYDATDLRLASDLRDKSDVLAIPALNKDVKTFNRMALALHYHMFQLVVLANNGKIRW